MKKGVDYLLSTLHAIYFGLILVIFDVLQRLAYGIFGKNAHQKVVNALNACICLGWYITGSTIKFNLTTQLPNDRSIIFISNHQSMFDIPGIIWFLRKHRPLFVSKLELAKGIPSISYNLRVGKAALINRKDKVQAMKEIGRLGEYICENNYSVAIFPEGTRSRNGKLKKFATGGISLLLKKCPTALVVPICIENLALFNPGGIFPLRSFTTLKWTILRPINKEDKSVEEIVDEARDAIKQHGDLEDRS